MGPYCFLLNLHFFWGLLCRWWWGIVRQFGHSSPHKLLVQFVARKYPAHLLPNFALFLYQPHVVINFGWGVGKRFLPILFIKVNLSSLIQARYHSFSPPCTYMHTPCANLFPTCLVTYIPFLTKMAMPPRFPDSLRCSNTWYPGITSWTDDFLSHVSYRHSMSRVCVPRSMYTFRREIPAMFWLPIWMPDFSQR